MLEEYEKIDNIRLIQNNLRHICYELESDEPSPMRLAKECYQLLLRMMVEALRGTANIAITERRSGDRKHWYKHGDNLWQMVQKTGIEGCSKAWKYSDPIYDSPPDRQEEGSAETLCDYLSGFYDLLAMIQAPCFMLRFVSSTAVLVSNAEMQLLEWLHESIRNDFEHFIPKTLLVSSDDCLRATEVCMRLSGTLLNESHNISPHRIGDLPAQLGSVSAAVSYLRARLNDQRSVREDLS